MRRIAVTIIAVFIGISFLTGCGSPSRSQIEKAIKASRVKSFWTGKEFLDVEHIESVRIIKIGKKRTSFTHPNPYWPVLAYISGTGLRNCIGPTCRIERTFSFAVAPNSYGDWTAGIENLP